MNFAWALALLALPVSSQEAGRRASVTFLLGEDEDARLPMFQLAADHFARDPQERTNHVVRRVRSLREARDYLARFAPEDGRPWGLVNLVAHGREGLMDVPVVVGGPRTTGASLDAARKDGSLPPLEDGVVDAVTEVRLHGCAVGRDAHLLKAMSLALGGEDDQRPLVRGTRWYTSYRPQDPQSEVPTRYLCQSWDVAFPPGSQPSPQALAQQFQTLHPGIAVDLEGALARDSARFQGDAFSYETPLTFTWTQAYLGREVPRLPAGPLATRKWLLSQADFQTRLHTTGFRYEDFRWDVRATHVEVHGDSYPALEVRGEARARHLLQGLRAEGTPPQLAFSDERYYASAR